MLRRCAIRRGWFQRGAEAICALVIGGGLFAASAQAERVGVFDTREVRVAVDSIVDGLDHPWGLAFLPDGRLIVTERDLGQVRIVDPTAPEGQRLSRPLSGAPTVDPRRQGGLLDVALHPEFETNRWVYFSLAAPSPDGGRSNSTGVHRARLSDDATRLENGELIFRQQPLVRSNHHFGSRLVFARDGTFFVTTGDRYGRADDAQVPDNHIGKIIRINADGSAPQDNPGPAGERAGWASEVWSIGHRNAQGAALHPETGQLWTAEHGARGGDEINTPMAGRNYGWPVITYGRDYSGASIGIGTAKAGMEQPLYYWDPSIAPSGLTFYTGDLFPAWRGNAFIGALAGTALHRVSLDGTRITDDEPMLRELGSRIRAVAQGPAGALWLLDDSEGRILKLTPAN